MTERITSLTFVDKAVLKSNIKETKSIPLTCNYVTVQDYIYLPNSRI